MGVADGFLFGVGFMLAFLIFAVVVCAVGLFIAYKLDGGGKTGKDVRDISSSYSEP